MNKLFLFLIIVVTIGCMASCKNYLQRSSSAKIRSGLPAAFVQSLKKGNKVTIVTMGTSLTGGTYRWPDIMMQDWLDKDFPSQVTLFNEGVGASSSSVGPGGNNQLSGLGRLPIVVAHKPDVVFIEFGINDAYLPYKISLSESRKNLEMIIDTILKANPKAEIILATMNSCKDDPKSDVKVSSDRPDLALYYQGYRDVAKAHNLLLIDYYPAWVKLMKAHPYQFHQFLPDGIHPTLEAYRSILLPILRKTLVP